MTPELEALRGIQLVSMILMSKVPDVNIKINAAINMSPTNNVRESSETRIR